MVNHALFLRQEGRKCPLLTNLSYLHTYCLHIHCIGFFIKKLYCSKYRFFVWLVGCCFFFQRTASSSAKLQWGGSTVIYYRGQYWEELLRKNNNNNNNKYINFVSNAWIVYVHLTDSPCYTQAEHNTYIICQSFLLISVGSGFPSSPHC